MNAFWNWLTWRGAPHVVVNLKTGDEAIAGVLSAQRGDWLLVKSPQMLRANGETTPADGEVLVHLNEVQFVQVLPPTQSAPAAWPGFDHN